MAVHLRHTRSQDVAVASAVWGVREHGAPAVLRAVADLVEQTWPEDGEPPSVDVREAVNVILRAARRIEELA